MLNSIDAVHKKQEEFPKLSSGELHLWSVSTNASQSALAKCRNALSDQELNRVPFFQFNEVRNSYIISQGTLRLLLSGYLGILPRKLEIERRKKGKPYSLDDPNLYFNISNSGKFAVFAFSRDGEIGIDLEEIRSLPDLDEMISRNFTSGEIKYIRSKPEEMTQRFFRFWTVKESYLKAIGEGMRLAPRSLEFTIDNDKFRLLSITGIHEQEDWCFKEFSIGTKCLGTLTYSKADTIVRQMQYFS